MKGFIDTSLSALQTNLLSEYIAKLEQHFKVTSCLNWFGFQTALSNPKLKPADQKNVSVSRSQEALQAAHSNKTKKPTVRATYIPHIKQTSPIRSVVNTGFHN